MSEHVWVRDNGTNHQFPMRRVEAEALGDAVRIDEDHPTHDAGGELLPVKYHVNLTSDDPLANMTVPELKAEIDRRNADRDPEGDDYITPEEPGNKPELVAALKADAE